MAKQKVALECLSYHATASQDQTSSLVTAPIKPAVEYKLFSFKFVGEFPISLILTMKLNCCRERDFSLVFHQPCLEKHTCWGVHASGSNPQENKYVLVMWKMTKPPLKKRCLFAMPTSAHQALVVIVYILMYVVTCSWEASTEWYEN